jgi:tRNA(Ile)-lysidine synthase
MGSSRNWPSSLFGDLPRDAAVCVGFSGGLDSAVLLDALASEAHDEGRTVRAVHVNHGISPNSNRWADACAKFCALRGVPLAIERVKVDRNSPEGLEAAARAERYRIYAAREEPYVALAHQLDDQAETVLLQLLRGTGLKGVAAMPEMRRLPDSNITIWRPLLAFSRGDLIDRAMARALKWIEDESNATTVHDRNYLRHEIAPLLDARFPGWREAVARFARHAASADALLEEIALDDGADAGRPFFDTDRVSMSILRPMSEARRANALRAFLQRHGLAMPSTAALEEIARQVYDARVDAEVRIKHDGVELVRKGERLYIESRPWIDGPWRVSWHGEAEIELGEGRGKVRFLPKTGEGMDASRIGNGEWHLAPRQGGERIRLGTHRPTRTLKNVVQERGFTRWHKQHYPCLFHDGRLVWMEGVGIDADYACPPGAAGLKPQWIMAPFVPSVLK